MDGIGDEHTPLLGLDWFGDVARTIGRGGVDKVAGLYKEWRRSVFPWWGTGGRGRGGDEEGVEEEACGEEEEEERERREREMAFLGEGDDLRAVSFRRRGRGGGAYDGFPASDPQWKHGGVV